MQKGSQFRRPFSVALNGQRHSWTLLSKLYQRLLRNTSVQAILCTSSSVKNSDLVETIGISGASLESILQGCGPEAVDFLRFPLPL